MGRSKQTQQHIFAYSSSLFIGTAIRLLLFIAVAASPPVLARPATASMRFFKRAHAVRLEVRVHDSTVYLGSPDSHSSRSNDSSSSSSSLSSSSTPSASLRGFVRFELDSPRTFDSLQVHFVGNL